MDAEDTTWPIKDKGLVVWQGKINAVTGLNDYVLESFSRGARPQCLRASLGRNLKIHRLLSPLSGRGLTFVRRSCAPLPEGPEHSCRSTSWDTDPGRRRRRALLEHPWVPWFVRPRPVGDRTGAPAPAVHRFRAPRFEFEDQSHVRTDSDLRTRCVAGSLTSRRQ
jgi:hypothetical protein